MLSNAQVQLMYGCERTKKKIRNLSQSMQNKYHTTIDVISLKSCTIIS